MVIKLIIFIILINFIDSYYNLFIVKYFIINFRINRRFNSRQEYYYFFLFNILVINLLSIIITVKDISIDQ